MRAFSIAPIAVAVVVAFSASSLAQEQAPSPGPFHLECLVDFPDDALASPVVITPAHVDAMMATLHDMGVTRVIWAYYGDGHGGYLLPSGLDGKWANYAKTLDALGNPLRVAAEAAHRHGLELYAYYKPYETGPAVYLPNGTPEARAYGRIQQRGGWLSWLDPFVIEHPDLRIRRRPEPAGNDVSNVPICAIKLIKKDSSPTRITREHLQVWTSPLNYRYQPARWDFTFTDAVEPSRRDVRDLAGTLITKTGDPVRTLTLSGPALTDPYVLVTTDFTEGPADFENAGTALLVALDRDGKEIPGVFASGNCIWNDELVNFRNGGLIFDVGFGDSLVQLDTSNASGHEGLIAFARGRNEYLPAALCETEPLVQQFWLSCIREMLDAGVDGVDFRVENHSTHTDFPEEYGYNDAVLRECARIGKTDPATVAQVRGEAYTTFLRQAKELIASRNKRMRINLNIDWFRPTPPYERRLAYSANIDYDWKRWVNDGLLDEGVMRIFALPFNYVFDDAIATDMAATCKAKNIPLVVNRYIHPEYSAEFTRVRQDGRFNGFILYESADYLHFQDPPPCTFQNDLVAGVCALMKEGKP